MSIAHPIQAVTASSLLSSMGIDGSSPSHGSTDVDLRGIFESRRPVRKLIPTGHSATIPMRTLNSELTCPVCLGIIQSCTAVMECLHRFCSSCIEKSLRFGKKECPSCRVACPSRRNLRKDAAFDAVIKAIYPDIGKAEEAQEKYISEVIKAHNVRNFGEIATKGARQQKDQARRSVKRPISPPPTNAFSHSTQLPLSKRPRNPNKPEPISFSIVQHPILSKSEQYGPMFLLENKFVRTSRYLTVLLLKKWLQLKLITDRERARKAAAATTTGSSAAPASSAAASSTSAPMDESKEGESNAAAAPAAPASSTTEATKEESESKMTDATNAAAASSTSSSPSSLATPIPNVRFVLYVRAFDTSLLAGSDAIPGMEPRGEEIFVPLASDLTLDYIEEHMWNSDSVRNTDATMRINLALQSLRPEEDAAPYLKLSFAQSFAKCTSHRKSKQPCPEDCTERVAAWTEYLARESEKLKEWRVAAEQAQEQAKEATATAAAQAAAAGQAFDPVMAQTQALAVTMPPPILQPPPVKKRRLVLYYSVVGADGQILLDEPSVAPEITQKYVIPDRGEGEEIPSAGQYAYSDDEAAPMQIENQY